MEAHLVIAYRKARGLTQKEMAAEFGVVQSSWSRWEEFGVTGFYATALKRYIEANPASVEA